MPSIPGPPSRLPALDALRGFALLGILMVNIWAFSSAYFTQAIPDPNYSRPVDQAVRWVVAFVFETKFYLLFSFLFGYSFTLQMQAAEREGRPFVPRMLRRHLGLGLIGAAHAVLLFHGDILGTYALLGLLLLALRHQPHTRVMWLACWLVALPAAGCLLLGAMQLLSGEWMKAAEAAAHAAAAARAEAAQRAYLGAPAGVMAQHLRELEAVWPVILLVQGPCAFAMFLVGFVAGKRRLVERVDGYPALRQWPVGRSLAVGLAGATVYASSAVFGMGTGWGLAGLGIGLLTAPFLTLGYIGLALALFAGPRGHRVAELLAPAGRMALSNYLLQSLVCALLFTAYGWRWMGRVSPGMGVLIVLGLFALQLVLSRLWLQRFAYGPVEWGLRALTVGAWPALRKAPERS